LAPYIAEQGLDVVVYGRGGTKCQYKFGAGTVTSIPTLGVDSKSLSTLTYGLFASIHCALFGPRTALIMNVANGFWLPLLRMFRVRTAVNVDGIEWERAKWGTVARAVFRYGARFTAKFADRLIFDAEAIGSKWSREFGVNGTFIPYGADLVKPQPVPQNLESGRFVLVVARLVPENTIIEFLTAAEILAQSWQVVVVGSSGYGGEIEELIRELASRQSNFRWLGHVSDDLTLAGLWQHCGVYFHGHSVGGTNPALVQAMACGAPTVARDTVFNREVLGTAALFAPPDGHAIADAIDSLMRDSALREEFSILGTTRAATHYNWTKVNAEYLRVLTSLRSSAPLPDGEPS
jgi:glycosyltransferase involved in cell wall biosynthesis